MDFLKQAIQQKKRKIQLEHQKVRKKKKVFVKRGDIEANRIKEYQKKQQAKDEQRRQKEQEKYQEMKDNLGPVQEEEVEVVSRSTLPKKEVLKRLKARGQPITLFAETDEDRAERLRKLELTEPMEYMEGTNNEAGVLLRNLEQEVEGDTIKRKTEENPLFKIEDREPTCDEEIILFFFRMLMKEWQKDMDSRPATEKKTAEGRSAIVVYKQSRSWIQPFFKLLVKKNVPDTIMRAVLGIVSAMKNRHYVKANDFYYSLAIGNSPWPMGVTMVGIHERSGREKIFSNKIAHVLNDETQRKYISCIKRLITFCQKRFPTTPSRSVG